MPRAGSSALRAANAKRKAKMPWLKIGVVCPPESPDCGGFAELRVMRAG